MITTKVRKTNQPLYLVAATAAELMTPSPTSVSEELSIREAAQFLTNKGINAAPVVDAAGRAIGVVSRADLLRFHADLSLTESTTVTKIMTPAILAVEPETPAVEVVAQMLAFKVHRLFVRDTSGVLIGIISAFDVVRKLRKP
jgi:CBS-domain-containing membrane protein